MANNLLDKSSIILTPTAYNNGEALCVKPSDGSGDFDFSRNSAATRVNAQGLVENVQILSSNLVQNGDFSEEGSEEVSNGSFSQEGVELITNGDFENGSANWNFQLGWTFDNGQAHFENLGSSNRNLWQSPLVNGNWYKLTFEITSITSGYIRNVNSSVTDDTQFSTIGVHTQYFQAANVNLYLKASVDANLSIDNVSVREVAQNWVFGTGVSIGENKAVFTSTPSGQSVSQNAVASQIPNGTSVKVSFEVLSISSGSFGVYFSGSLVGSLNSVGVATFYFEKGTETSFYIRALGTTTGSITNISVKEVGQNWDLQTGWQISNNKLNCLGASSQIEASTLLNFDITKKYKLVFTISGVDSGTRSFRVYTQGSNGGVIFSYTAHTNGTYEYYYDPSINGTKLAFQTAFNQSTFSIDDVSVIEITDDTNLPRISYENFSYQDVLGSELVVNGGFDSDTAWTKGSGWAIANGVATHTGGASYLSQSILNADTQYKVNISVTAVSGGGFVQIYMGNSPASVLISTIGDYTYYFTSQ